MSNQQESAAIIPSMQSPVFGIQGGKGSFNEEAISYYTNNRKIKEYSIKYLFTSENVLNSLDKGDIDYGQFAIENSIGGLVEESIEAMSKHVFKIVEKFEIPIRHCLIKRKDTPITSINTLMAHPQVFKQCKSTIQNRFSKYHLKTGKGELIDPAKIAESLKIGKIEPTTAILGPKILSEIYDLEIVEENLQDAKDNYTSFLIVTRVS